MAYPIQSPMVMGPMQGSYMQQGMQPAPVNASSGITSSSGAGGGFMENLQQIQQQLQAAYAQAQQIAGMQQQAGNVQQQATSAMGVGVGQGGNAPGGFSGGIAGLMGNLSKQFERPGGAVSLPAPPIAPMAPPLGMSFAQNWKSRLSNDKFGLLG